MSSRKTTLFYAMLLAVASLAVGMVIASRLDLSPASSAQTMAPPPMNSTPLSGPVDAATFRTVAKAVSPAVVNIRSTSKQRVQEMTEFFGGGGDDLLERFFGGGGRGQGQGGQQAPREQETQAAGTGFVISKDGHILTNNHVVDGATKSKSRSTARTRMSTTRPGSLAATRSPTARSSNWWTNRRHRSPRSSSATPLRWSRVIG
jgi:serine protease Do